jgi:RNA polymerase sigma factor (sigma-70 family)
MADERDLEYSTTPDATPPPGKAASGRPLRSQLLRDRPTVAPEAAPAGADLEVAEHQLKQAVQAEATPNSIPGVTPSKRFDPDRSFHARFLENPYTRELFADEIETQTKEDAAWEKHQLERQKQIDAEQKKAAAAQAELRDSRLEAERDRHNALMKLESARTNREFIDDPDKPGYLRPVLSDEEWKAKVRSEQDEKMVADRKKRDSELRAELNARQSAIAGTKMGSSWTETAENKFREERDESVKRWANQRRQKLDEARKEKTKVEGSGLFGTGLFAKEKETEAAAEAQREYDRLIGIIQDPSSASESDLNEALPQEMRQRQVELEQARSARDKDQEIDQEERRWNLLEKALLDGNATHDEVARALETGVVPDKFLDPKPGQPKAGLTPTAAPTEARSIKPRQIQYDENGSVDLMDVARDRSPLTSWNRTVDREAYRQEAVGVYESIGQIDEQMSALEKEIKLENEAFNELAAEYQGKPGSTQELDRRRQELSGRREKVKEMVARAKVLNEKRNSQVEAYSQKSRELQTVATADRVIASEKRREKPVAKAKVEYRELPTPDSFKEEARRQVEAAKEKAKAAYRAAAPPLSGSVGFQQMSTSDAAAIDQANEELAEAQFEAEFYESASETLAAKRTKRVIVDGKPKGWIETQPNPNGFNDIEVMVVEEDALQDVAPTWSGKIQVIRDLTELRDQLKQSAAVDSPGARALARKARTEIYDSMRGSQSRYQRDLKITPEKFTEVEGAIEDLNEKIADSMRESGADRYVELLVAGDLSEEEAQAGYNQALMDAQEKHSEPRQSMIETLAEMRDIAQRGGGDLNRVVSLFQRVGVPLEAVEKPEAFADEWMSQNIDGIPMSTDYIDALKEYRMRYGNQPYYNSVLVEKMANRIYVMGVMEQNLRNRVIIHELGRNRNYDSEPLTSEEEAYIDEQVNLAIQKSGGAWELTKDAPARFAVGLLGGSFGMRGATELGNIFGAGIATMINGEVVRPFSRIADQPMEGLLEEAERYGLLDEDAYVKIPQIQPGEPLTPRAYIRLLDLKKKDPNLDEATREQAALLEETVRAMLGADIENNVVADVFRQWDDLANTWVDPKFDESFAAHTFTGAGSLVQFLIPGGIAHKGSQKILSGVNKATGFAKGAQLFRGGMAKSTTAFHGAFLNTTEGVRYAQEWLSKNPNIANDDIGYRDTLLVLTHSLVGMSEAMPIERAIKKVDFAKISPDTKKTLMNFLIGGTFEGAQEGFVAAANMAAQQAILTETSPEEAMAGVLAEFEPNFREMMSQFVGEEAQIGAILGVLMEAVATGAAFKKYRRVRGVMDSAKAKAEESNSILFEQLRGPDAGDALLSFMSEGALPPSPEEIKAGQDIVGDAEEAAGTIDKKIALLEQQLETATETFGWSSKEASQAEEAIINALYEKAVYGARKVASAIEGARETRQGIETAQADAAQSKKQMEDHLAEAQAGPPPAPGPGLPQSLAQSQEANWVPVKMNQAKQAEKASLESQAAEVRYIQAQAATKIAQGRESALTEAERQSLEGASFESTMGNETVVVEPAVTDVAGVTIVTDKTIDWMKKNTPSASRLISMSESEVTKRAGDGTLGVMPTPDAAPEMTDEGQRQRQRQQIDEVERQKEVEAAGLDPAIADLPDFQPATLAAVTPGATPVEKKLRAQAPMSVKGAVANTQKSASNLTELERANIAQAAIATLAEAFRGAGGTFSTVTFDPKSQFGVIPVSGKVVMNPAVLAKIAIDAVARGATVTDALAELHHMVKHEQAHVGVAQVASQKELADIWMELPQEIRETVLIAYFQNAYNEAAKRLEIDPEKVTPRDFAQDPIGWKHFEQAEDPAYMAQEYFRMLIQSSRDGVIDEALNPPTGKLLQKILDILERLVEKITGQLDQLSKTDPDLHQRVVQVRDDAIAAIEILEEFGIEEVINAGLGETLQTLQSSSDREINTPQERIKLAEQEGIISLVAARYRNTQVFPGDLIDAAKIGVLEASQKDLPPDQWIKFAVTSANNQVLKLLRSIRRNDLPFASVRSFDYKNDSLGERLASASLTPDENVARAEGEKLLQEAVDSLPTKQRQVTQMILEGMSAREIGREIGISHTAVNKILSAAADKLRFMLDKADMVRSERENRHSVTDADMNIAADYMDLQESAGRDPDYIEPSFGVDLRAVWGEGENQLIWKENKTGATVELLTREAPGVTGGEMLAWLRDRVPADLPINVSKVFPSAEGFFAKAKERGLVTDYELGADLFPGEQRKIQDSALRGDMNELRNHWADSHPLTKAEDGVPKSWFRGHFEKDGDIFRNRSRIFGFLGGGDAIYFTDNVHDASKNYADPFSRERELLVEDILENVENRINEGETFTLNGVTYDSDKMDGMQWDESNDILKQIAIDQLSEGAQIAPVYLKMKNPAILDPQEGASQMWEINYRQPDDVHREDAVTELLEDYRAERTDALANGDERNVRDWLREEYPSEVEERARDIMLETEEDAFSGNAYAFMNGMIDFLKNGDPDIVYQVENSPNRAIAQMKEQLTELSDYGPMQLDELLIRLFGDHFSPRSGVMFGNRPSRPKVDIDNPGELVKEGLKAAGYDGILMDASHYFPAMEAVDETKTKHAIIWDVDTTYGMFGGLARKRKDPLQWAASRAEDFEDVEPKASNNQAPLVKMIVSKIYEQDMGGVIVREMTQNSLDAIRPLIEGGNSPGDHRIKLIIDSDNRTIEMTDTGHGMLPNIVQTALINITESFKQTAGSGGYGVAKAAIFGTSEAFEVETVARASDGSLTKTTMTGDGDAWFATVDNDPDKSKQVKISVERNFKAEEKSGEVVRQDLSSYQGDILIPGFELKLVDKGSSKWLNLPRESGIESEVPAIAGLNDVDLRAAQEKLIQQYDDYVADGDKRKRILEMFFESEYGINPESFKKAMKQTDRAITSSDTARSYWGSSVYNKVGPIDDFNTAEFIESEVDYLRERTPYADRVRMGRENLAQLTDEQRESLLRFKSQEEVADGMTWYTWDVQVDGYTFTSPVSGWSIEDAASKLPITLADATLYQTDLLENEVVKKFTRDAEFPYKSATVMAGDTETYTRIRTKIEENVDFDFSEADKVFRMAGDYDLHGIVYDLAITTSDFNWEKYDKGDAPPFSRSKTKDLAPLSGFETDRGFYKAYSSPNVLSGRNNIPVMVLNRGLYQFGYDLKLESKDIQMPEYIVVDVDPKVDPVDKNYPFTLNRDNLISNERTKLASYVTDKYIEDARRAKNEMMRNRWKSAPVLATLKSEADSVDLKILDLNGANDQVSNKLASHPGAQRMAREANRVSEEIMARLAETGWEAAEKGRFLGFQIGSPSTYGVNVSTKYHIGNTAGRGRGFFVDPINIQAEVVKDRPESRGLNQYRDLPSQMAASIWTTIAHEINHNDGSGDWSADFSYNLTDHFPRLAPMINDHITQFGDQLRQIYEETNLEEFLDELYKQQDVSAENIFQELVAHTGVGSSRRPGSPGNANDQVAPAQRNEERGGLDQSRGENLGSPQIVPESLRGYQEAASRPSSDRQDPSDLTDAASLVGYQETAMSRQGIELKYGDTDRPVTLLLRGNFVQDFRSLAQATRIAKAFAVALDLQPGDLVKKLGDERMFRVATAGSARMELTPMESDETVEAYSDEVYGAQVQESSSRRDIEQAAEDYISNRETPIRSIADKFAKAQEAYRKYSMLRSRWDKAKAKPAAERNKQEVTLARLQAGELYDSPRLKITDEEREMIRPKGLASIYRDMELVQQPTFNPPQKPYGQRTKNDWVEGLSNEERDQMGEALAYEAMQALTQDGNALGWYDRTMKRAIREAKKVFPELSNKRDQAVFKAILAITSNGQVVKDQFGYAYQVFDQWLASDRKVLPSNGNWGGERTEAINTHFALLSDIIDKWGLAGAQKFLDGYFEVGTINKFGKKTWDIRSEPTDKNPQGKPKNLIEGEASDAIVQGSMIFGPKLGNFYANMSGDFSAVTMDRWFMRTFGRVRGDLISLEENDKQLKAEERLRTVAKKNGMVPPQNKDDFSDWVTAQVRANDKRYVEAREKGLPAPKSTTLSKALKRYLTVSGLKDAPTGPGERREIRRVMRVVQEKLRKNGILLNNADLQAILWYYEKDLVESFGGPKRGEAADYAVAAKQLAETFKRASKRLGPGGGSLTAGARREILSLEIDPERLEGRTIELGMPLEGEPNPWETESELQESASRFDDFKTNSTVLNGIIKKSRDGFTLNPQGEFAESGFVVAASKSTETLVGREFTDQDLEDYLFDHADLFDLEGSRLGGWFDIDTNRFMLDVSFPVVDRQTAIDIALAADQDSIYDANNKQLIDLRYEGRPTAEAAAKRRFPDPSLLPRIASEATRRGQEGLGQEDRVVTEGPTRGPGDGEGRSQGRGASPEASQALDGVPRIKGATGPDVNLVSVAQRYAQANGIPFARQPEYVQIDEDRARRLAQAYEAMEHAPSDPAVREAYADLIRQTTDQYRALEEAGYQFYFFDETTDPYNGNPWNAMRDLRANRRIAVFATEAGFGSGATDIDVSDNPLMSDTGIEWPWGSPTGPKKPVLANDLFRAVHDAFGHGLEGAGFRARGEENAWQAHARLFTGPALGALTSETRGQNHWLNYGPYSEKNQTAKVEDIIFADQKTGLMPEWTWTEGITQELDVLGAPAITPEQDADYLAAVESGDMDTAQRMVDEAAKAAGYGVGPAFHATNSEKFDVFNVLPAYFSNLRSFSERFASKRVETVYLKLKNPEEIDGEQSGRHFEWDEEDVSMFKGEGKDGVRISHPEGDVYTVFDPNQIKSADPVTYDADGNVIPLSQRFNPKSDLLQEAAFRDGELVYNRVVDRFNENFADDASVEEVMSEIDDLGPEERNFYRALGRDDWLGFDYPSQTINAILTEPEAFELSQGTKSALGRYVNSIMGSGFQGTSSRAMDEMMDEDAPVLGSTKEAYEARQQSGFTAFYDRRRKTLYTANKQTAMYDIPPGLAGHPMAEFITGFDAQRWDGGYTYYLNLNIPGVGSGTIGGAEDGNSITEVKQYLTRLQEGKEDFYGYAWVPDFDVDEDSDPTEAMTAAWAEKKKTWEPKKTVIIGKPKKSRQQAAMDEMRALYGADQRSGLQAIVTKSELAPENLPDPRPLAAHLLASLPDRVLTRPNRYHAARGRAAAGGNLRAHYIQRNEDATTYLHEVMHLATLNKTDQIHRSIKPFGQTQDVALEGDAYIRNLENFMQRDREGNRESEVELVRLFLLARENYPQLNKPSVENPDKQWNQAKKAGLDPNIGYGLANLNEFIAQSFSSKPFQEALNEIVDPEAKGKTLWQSLIEAIRRLFQIPVNQGSVLEGVINTVADMGGLEQDVQATAPRYDERLGKDWARPVLSKQSRTAKDTMAVIPTEKIEQNWSKDTGFYLPPGGEENTIGKRYENFGEFIASAPEYNVPEIYIDPKGKVGFTNGRHTFSWLRDNGVTAMPVALERDAVRNAIKLGWITQDDIVATQADANISGETRKRENIPGKIIHFDDVTFHRQPDGSWTDAPGGQVNIAFFESDNELYQTMILAGFDKDQSSMDVFNDERSSENLNIGYRGDPDEYGDFLTGDAEQDAEKILGEFDDHTDYAKWIEGMKRRHAEKKGEFTQGVPRLANPGEDPQTRAAISISQYVYDQERKRERFDDWAQAGEDLANRDPEGVKREILTAAYEKRGLGGPEMTIAAKIVTARAMRDATRSGSDEEMRQAVALSKARQLTRSEVAKEMAAGRDTRRSPEERHAEMIADFLVIPERARSRQKRVGIELDRLRNQTRKQDLLKSISNAKTPEEAAQYRGELDRLQEDLDAAKRDAETQQKTIKKLENALMNFGVTLRDVFDNKAVKEAKENPAVEKALATFQGKDRKIAEMLLKRMPSKRIQKKHKVSRETVEKVYGELRIQLAKKYDVSGTQMMAERSQTTDADQFVDALLPPLEVIDRNRWAGNDFDMADPAQAGFIARVISTFMSGGVSNSVHEFWINSILSGPQTQSINIFSNTLSVGWDATVQRGVEVIVNQLLPAVGRQKGTRGEAAQLGELTRLWRGFLRGMAPGLSNARKAWSTEMDFFESQALSSPAERTFDEGKVESHQPSIPDRVFGVGTVGGRDIASAAVMALLGKGGRGVSVGATVRIPGRALGFADSYYKTVIGHGEVAAQAYRIAKAEVKAGQLKSEQMEDRIAELMEYGSVAWEFAVEKAKELTFTNSFDPENGNFDKMMFHLQRLKSGKANASESALLKLLVSFYFPFLRTPTRIFQMGLRKTPVGSLNLLIKMGKAGIANFTEDGKVTTNSLYGQKGRSELVRDLAEQIIAWSVFAFLYDIAEGDDDDEDKQLLVVGSRPFMQGEHGERKLSDRLYGGATIIRAGGREGFHIDYGRYEPISTVLTTVVDMIRAHKSHKQDQDTAKSLSQMWGYFTNHVQSKTFLTGIDDLNSTIDKMQTQSGRERLLKEGPIDFLTGFVPNLFRQPVRNLDELPREYKSGNLYKLTGLGRYGIQKVDLYGRPVERSMQDIPQPLRGITRLLMRTPTDADELHPGDQFMSRIAAFYPALADKLPTPYGSGLTNKFKGPDGEYQDMDPAQRAAFQKLSGELFSMKVYSWEDGTQGTGSAQQAEDDLDDFKKLLSDARREAKDTLFKDGFYIGN